MFAFQLLRPSLTDHMLVRGQVSVIDPPAVGVKATNPTGREQPLEFQQDRISTTAKGIGHDPACLMIERFPQSPWVLLAADEGPRFLQLCFLALVDHPCRGDSFLAVTSAGFTGWSADAFF